MSIWNHKVERDIISVDPSLDTDEFSGIFNQALRDKLVGFTDEREGVKSVCFLFSRWAVVIKILDEGQQKKRERVCV